MLTFMKQEHTIILYNDARHWLELIFSFISNDQLPIWQYTLFELQSSANASRKTEVQFYRVKFKHWYIGQWIQIVKLCML